MATFNRDLRVANGMNKTTFFFIPGHVIRPVGVLKYLGHQHGMKKMTSHSLFSLLSSGFFYALVRIIVLTLVDLVGILVLSDNCC